MAIPPINLPTGSPIFNPSIQVLVNQIKIQLNNQISSIEFIPLNDADDNHYVIIEKDGKRENISVYAFNIDGKQKKNQ